MLPKRALHLRTSLSGAVPVTSLLANAEVRVHLDYRSLLLSATFCIAINSKTTLPPPSRFSIQPVGFYTQNSIDYCVRPGYSTTTLQKFIAMTLSFLQAFSAKQSGAISWDEYIHILLARCAGVKHERTTSKARTINCAESIHLATRSGCGATG